MSPFNLLELTESPRSPPGRTPSRCGRSTPEDNVDPTPDRHEWTSVADTDAPDGDDHRRSARDRRSSPTPSSRSPAPTTPRPALLLDVRVLRRRRAVRAVRLAGEVAGPSCPASTTFAVRAVDLAGNAERRRPPARGRSSGRRSRRSRAGPAGPTADTTATFDVRRRPGRLDLRVLARRQRLRAVHVAADDPRARRRRAHLRGAGDEHVRARRGHAGRATSGRSPAPPDTTPPDTTITSSPPADRGADDGDVHVHLDRARRRRSSARSTAAPFTGCESPQRVHRAVGRPAHVRGARRRPGRQPRPDPGHLRLDGARRADDDDPHRAGVADASTEATFTFTSTASNADVHVLARRAAVRRLHVAVTFTGLAPGEHMFVVVLDRRRVHRQRGRRLRVGDPRRRWRRRSPPGRRPTP